MAEVEKLLIAKDYCEKLANGIDPISDKAMPQDSVLNQVQLARLFFFLKDYIVGEISPSNKSKNSSSTKLPFLVTRDDLSQFEFSAQPISITVFSKLVNACVKNDSRLFSYKWATEWLLNAGFLVASENDNTRLPTDDGKKIGISNEVRMGQYAEYRVTLYNKDAQQFLIDNMDAILSTQGYSILP